MGTLHLTGRGVPRSLSKARQWYERAASNGFDDADVWLASLDARIADAKSGGKAGAKKVQEDR